MTRLLLITLLMLSSGPAYAEWVSIGANNQRGRTVYTDPDTIRLKGDVVTMWSLNDYKTRQTMGSTSYLSYKVQTEYTTVQKSEFGSLHLRSSPAIWAAVMWFIASQRKASGN